MSPYSNPSNPFHIKLEEDVKQFLNWYSFLVVPSGCRDLYPSVFDTIKVTDSLASLELRTSSDYLAIYSRPTLGVLFRVEIKTITPDYDSLGIEALPLAHHRRRARMGCPCLYVVRDSTPGREYEGGFWVGDKLPSMTTLFLTNKYPGQLGQDLKRLLLDEYRECEPVDLGMANGSSDPFVRLHRHRFPELLTKQWQQLVIDLIAPKPTPTPEDQWRQEYADYTKSLPDDDLDGPPF